MPAETLSAGKKRKSNKNRLRVRRVVHVPLREVSGICLGRRDNNRMFLIAVGSQSQGLVRGGALADGERWPINKGHHRFVALAIWRPDKALAKTCADFSDLEIGPDGCLYLLSDKSSTIARLDDLPAGGGTATLLEAWQLGDLDGKPEGLAFTALGRAVVGLDTRKARRNLVLLDPAIAPLRGGGQREPEAKQGNGEAQGGSNPVDLPVQAQAK